MTKLAYAARLRYAGDRDHNPPPLDRLLSEKHLALEAAKIKPDKAKPWKAPLAPGPTPKGARGEEHTTHFVVYKIAPWPAGSLAEDDTRPAY